jgi:VWFA-related protein
MNGLQSTPKNRRTKLCRSAPLLALVFLAVAPGLAAQSAPPAPPAASANVASVSLAQAANHLMTLDVHVTDKSGNPVRGLQLQDFTILDNNHPQTIGYFEPVESGGTDNPPAEVILAIDAVNAAFSTVGYEHNQIRNFLLQNGGELPAPVSIIAFTSNGTKIVKTSSRDGKQIAAAYDAFQTGLRDLSGSQGVFGAQERFDLSLRSFDSLAAYAARIPGRKLIIWVSPGWPLLLSPNLHFSSQSQQQLFGMILKQSAGLSRSRITVYSIDPNGTEDVGISQYYSEFLKGVSAPDRVQPGNLALQVLAIQSGGRALIGNNDISAAIASCIAESTDYYVVAFAASPTEAANQYHTLTIKIDKPNATARTRTGYYAQP